MRVSGGVDTERACYRKAWTVVGEASREDDDSAESVAGLFNGWHPTRQREKKKSYSIPLPLEVWIDVNTTCLPLSPSTRLHALATSIGPLVCGAHHLQMINCCWCSLTAMHDVTPCPQQSKFFPFLPFRRWAVQGRRAFVGKGAAPGGLKNESGSHLWDRINLIFP